MKLRSPCLSVLFITVTHSYTVAGREARGFTQGVRNPLSCASNRGICVPIRCPGSLRQIGTCVGAPVKCCRRW
ncbi:hypothetical protein FD755_015341 [Muntiacus reevesi]|uniref:Beta/alpha-defensin C-terminal domain-containing protein n=1 Tax=Muntiacus reevesi TaxID=9886 RepID=A0A5N3XJ60_MUNRE|nr:hypothetical protein FD755_015341 [Muntiacus reevesi]